MSEFRIVTVEEAEKLPNGSVILSTAPGGLAITRDGGVWRGLWNHPRDCMGGTYRVLYTPPRPPVVGESYNRDEVTEEWLASLPVHSVLMDSSWDVAIKTDGSWQCTGIDYSKINASMPDWLSSPVRVLHLGGEA